VTEIQSTNHLSSSELPDGYRITELGFLPENWTVVRGGEIFCESKLRVRDLGDKFDGIVLSITRHAGLIPQTEKFDKKVASHDLGNYKIVYRGQLVYGFPINEGVIAVSRFAVGAVSPTYCVWNVIRKDVDPEFMDWLVRQPFMIAQYMRFASNVVHRRRTLKPQDFLKVLFPLPPLSEQRAIAPVLRTIQRAKEATERVIAASRELKKSLMRHLFTYGPVPIDQIDQVPTQETEIGPIPSHWRAVKLREVAQMKYGKAKPESSGSIPVIGSGGIYDWTSEALVSHPTIVIGRKGTAGKVWLAEVPCWPSDTTFYLVWKCSIDVRFFYYCLSHKPLSGEHAKTTLPSLQRQDLENYLVPLPPLSEQQEIARILNVVDEKIRAEEMRKQALEQLFKSLLHNLMTAKIRLPESFVKQFKEGEIHE